MFDCFVFWCHDITKNKIKWYKCLTEIFFIICKILKIIQNWEKLEKWEIERNQLPKQIPGWIYFIFSLNNDHNLNIMILEKIGKIIFFCYIIDTTQIVNPII